MSSRLSLIKNTFFLYMLTFSSYLINFALIPYETRVLKPEMYGLLGVATAAMTYFQLVMDFGFLLSATEEVAKNRDDRKKMSEIFTSVTLNKIFLAVLSGICLVILSNIIPNWKENRLFFYLMFTSTAINTMIPDYLYRGIEKMGVITVRTVLIKLFFAMLVFVFVKEPSDYILIPIINIVGNSAALAGVYLHLWKKIKVGFTKCTFGDLVYRMRKSATFFLSRIATTAYTVSNTVILGIISGNAAAAYYTTADKLISTAKSAVSPISDSLYPYMVKNRDFRTAKRILLVLEPLIFLACAVVFVFAEPLCVWFFGAEYRESASVLRTLLPVAVFVFPNYVLGFPVLGAMGLSKHANYSIIFASAVHIINLCVLYFSGNLNLITLGLTTSIAEGLILLYRSIVIFKNKNLCAR